VRVDGIPNNIKATHTHDVNINITVDPATLVMARQIVLIASGVSAGVAILKIAFK
jgi:hypothetical protein